MNDEIVKYSMSQGSAALFLITLRMSVYNEAFLDLDSLIKTITSVKNAKSKAGSVLRETHTICQV